jgi:aminoglycoside/choline kinase family phosphotransferase
MKEYYNSLKSLFKKYYGSQASEIFPLPPSGSNRQYFRLKKNDFTAIAAYNPDRAENEAFLYITGKLKAAGANVPEIYAENLNQHVYLQQDLGDMDLFKKKAEEHHDGNEGYIDWYKKVIENMPSIQYRAAKDFDFSKCYPRHAFDKQSMHWDLNYFKYHFLKLAYTPFHEQKLEDDFHVFVDFLMEAPSDFFLFRDFQSRNIMIHDEKVWFIDYQGGRKGALQYDLASLLFEAKTSLSPEIRIQLLNYYQDIFSEYSFFDRKIFMKYFPGFALIRILQAFGAYGYRGYFERKPYFLQSIPPAITNLRWLLSNYDLGINVPHLTETLHKMADQPAFQVSTATSGKLTVSINSFSYRKGMPEDFTGNGGGFVFDCRVLPNPGRLEEFRSLNGKDKPVVDFLADKQEVNIFIERVCQLVGASIDEYISRGYEHLMVSFGCTGGQHRSVYCAETLYRVLKNKYNINLSLKHKEQQGSI